MPPPKFGSPPVTNIRNTSSPHWRAWLKPENRCLVPFNSFAEYAPEPNPETKKGIRGASGGAHQSDIETICDRLRLKYRLKD
jgi:putative SOS response-associated peptidase YedK